MAYINHHWSNQLEVIQIVKGRSPVCSECECTCIWKVQFLVNEYPGQKLYHGHKRTLQQFNNKVIEKHKLGGEYNSFSIGNFLE